MEPKEIDRQLMLDYLQGNCTVAQLRLIKEYLHDEVYRESLDKFLQEEWLVISRSPLPELPGIDRQYEKFQNRLIPGRTRTGIRRLVWLTTAAAALLLLLFSVWLLRPGQPRRDDAAQWIVFHNAPGQKRKITLPDSSVIYLATASTIKYNGGYNSTNRDIFLEGEAYFIVNHGGRQPFTVVTGGIATIDIGTEFDIRYYPGKPSIEVAVAKGKVEVQSTKRDASVRIATLTQGQGLLYDTLTAGATVSILPDAGLVGAWRKGILSFHQRPLKEVTDELERYYGVSIRYSDPTIGDMVLTTLLDNTTLDDALDIVTVTAGVTYTRQGDTILLGQTSGQVPAKK
ncbi:MAG TPA: FecR domain-containing protein [Puia sp.]